MQDIQLDDILDQLDDEHRPPADFREFAWYNADGDTLEIYLRPGPRVAERINDLLTVFVSAANRDRVQGIAIKNLKKHFANNKLAKIHLASGRARVDLILATAQHGEEITLVRQGAAARAQRGAIDEARLSDLSRRLADYEVDIPEEALVGVD